MSHIKPLLPFVWIPDEYVDNCSACKIEFNFINRRHHCRFCGKIYCSSCLPYTHQHSWDEKLEGKCCFSCNKNMRTKVFHKTKNIILSNLPLFINDLKVFLVVNKQWNNAVAYVLALFKGIQHKFTFARWNKLERMLIRTHFNELRNHPKYFIQALKCLYGIKGLNKLMMSNSYARKCSQVYCSTPCLSVGNQNKFTIYNMVDLLYNKPTILEYSNVLEWCMKIFSFFHTDEITIFLPWLLDIGVTKGSQEFIVKSLIPRCSQLNFAYKFYFECKMFFSSSNKEFYVSLLQKMMMQCEYKNDIHFTERFVIRVQSGVYDHEDNLNVRMPYDPNIIVQKICIDKIKKINSFTQPVQIPMITSKGKINVLVKNEDVRPDRLAVLMMFLMNQFDDFNFKPYSVFAIDNYSGWIEMLDNVKTLYDIEKTNSFSNYVLSKNQTKNIQEIRRTFIKSCASNCILTYVLGVGDRNLCNILVHDDGSLIHIDYSYILGHDPKWQKVEMRITNGMVDLLGGKDSIEFEQLKLLCTSMYKQIRKHAYFWSVFIHYLGKTSPPIEKYYGKKKHIKKHIEERLMLNSSSDEINMFIVETVDKNSGSSLMSYISDTLFHARSTLDEYLFTLEI